MEEDFIHSKFGKRLIYGTQLVLFLPFLTFMLYNAEFKGNDDIINSYKNERYNGFIERTYVPYSIHQGSIWVNKTMYNINNNYYYNVMRVGDYIIKRQGTLQYLLIKNVDTLIGDTLVFEPLLPK